MENIVYIVSDNRGSKKKSIKKDFQELVDDLVQDEIANIIKEYRYNGKTYRLTLYTSEQEFGAEEYISHYHTLTKQYCHDFLTNFDIEVIRQFSS